MITGKWEAADGISFELSIERNGGEVIGTMSVIGEDATPQVISAESLEEVEAKFEEFKSSHIKNEMEKGSL